MDDTPPIEIFRPGTFTAVDGEQYAFSRDDLLASIAAYDPAGEPAPLVIGHPKLDDPAYGWVGSVELDGDIMLANPIDVEPAFAEAVRAKRYRRVSASWYPPTHPANPKPGVWYLRHVGFLGAAAPAVRGLKPVNFSEDRAAGAVSFEIDPAKEEQSMSEKTADFAAREEELNAREARIAAREKEVAEQAAKARHDEAVSFAEAQVAAGKLAPAGKALVAGILENLEATKTVSFGEADGDLAPAAAFRKLFDGANRLVSFGEFAPREEAEDKDGSETRSPEEIAKAAADFAAAEKEKGRDINVAAAVRHVSKKGA